MKFKFVNRTQPENQPSEPAEPMKPIPSRSEVRRRQFIGRRAVTRYFAGLAANKAAKKPVVDRRSVMAAQGRVMKATKAFAAEVEQQAAQNSLTS